MSSFSFQPITLPLHNRLKNTTPFSTNSPPNPNTSGFISRRLRQSRPHASTNTSVTISRRDALMTSITLLSSLQLLPTSPPAEAAEKQTDTCQLTVSPSGLAYCDRVVGTGSAAMKGQLIKAHYTGKLENGNVFDSSYPRGRPLTFRVGVGEVIKGWDLGILGGGGVPPMLAGGKRTLKLPPELGYGAKGAGCKGGSCVIPPDSTLLFDVEFLG